MFHPVARLNHIAGGFLLLAVLACIAAVFIAAIGFIRIIAGHFAEVIAR